MSERDPARPPPGPPPDLGEAHEPSGESAALLGYRHGTASLDTLAAVDRLRAAGFEEGHARAIVDLHRTTGGTLATKADLDALATALWGDLSDHRAATKADLEEHRANTKADLDALRKETKADLDAIAAAVKADLKAELADHRFTTKEDLDALRRETTHGLDALRRETKADLHREIGGLRSEIRWMLGFQALLIIAMAAKLFGIV